MTPQEKTALLNEVIEYMNEMYINGKTHPFVYINDIKQKLYTMMRPDENESLLPKEEPIDWSKASDEELIAEAKRRYPSGTKYITVNVKNVSFSGIISEPSYKEVFIHRYKEYGRCVENGVGYCYSDLHGWAEIVEEPERQIKEDVKPEPTQEIKIEEKSISDFISEIKIDKSNFEHIAKTGKINGSLFLEIQDKMRAFACQEVTSVLFMDSEQEEAISKITHDAVTKLKKELLTKVQPTKTQEEMDREWKRESLIAHPMNDDSLDDLLQKAINYGRNTKQN